MGSKTSPLPPGGNLLFDGDLIDLKGLAFHGHASNVDSLESRQLCRFRDLKHEVQTWPPTLSHTTREEFSDPRNIQALRSLKEPPSKPKSKTLTTEQEQYLFKRYNLLKYIAGTLLEKLNPESLDSDHDQLLEEIEAVWKEGQVVRNRLLNANTGLAAKFANKKTSPTYTFDEAFSDGYQMLLKAIEGFDYSRGFKFSTFAWRVFRSGFFKVQGTALREGRLLHPEGEELVKSFEDPSLNSLSEELRKQAQIRGFINKALRILNPREKAIVAGRYGLIEGEEPKTLEQLGDELGVSKERIRQLQDSALVKVVGAFRKGELALPEDFDIRSLILQPGFSPSKFEALNSEEIMIVTALNEQGKMNIQQLQNLAKDQTQMDLLVRAAGTLELKKIVRLKEGTYRLVH